MKKSYLLIIVLIVVVGGILFFANRGSAPSSPTENGNNLSNNSETQKVPQASTGGTVIYTDKGFSPPVLQIKAGMTVVFKNSSLKDVWPASDPHPAHNGYPQKGTCRGWAFDACNVIPPGGSWSFKFDLKGSWGYHNHLAPSERGTIIVE